MFSWKVRDYSRGASRILCVKRALFSKGYECRLTLNKWQSNSGFLFYSQGFFVVLIKYLSS